MTTALLDSLLSEGLTDQITTGLPERPLRIGIVCRISKDDEEEGKGVARQKADCLGRQRDKYPNAESIEYYIDNDITAMGTKKRPQFERLLRDMRAGRLDVVIMWHTDRTWRRIEELSRIMDAWGVHRPEIAAITVGLVDFTTPTGRFLARVMAIVGQYEVEHLIERVLRKKRELREEGMVQGGGRPFGYQDGGYEIEPRETARIRTAARRILVGDQSATDVAREWNRLGVVTARGTRWDGTKVRRVLTRYRNVAIVEHEGRPVAAAKWKPILDEETWTGLRAVLGDGTSTRKYKPRAESMLPGIATCGECGAVLRSAGGDPRGNRRVRCSVSHHLKRLAKPIEDHVEAVVVGILSRPDAIKLLGTGKSEDKIRELHATAAARQATIDEAGSMFADGEIDRDQLRDITAKARTKLVEVEAELAAMTAGSVLDGVVGLDAATAWVGLDLDRKRAIIDHLVEVKVHRGATGGDRRSKGRAKRFVSTVEVTEKVRV